MNDSFITSINVQKTTASWIDSLTENLANIYTPGYRESQTTFITFLEGSISDSPLRNVGQGKSSPGTSNENIFLEGTGFFVIRDDKGKVAYTRLGEFKFDGEGVYKTTDGKNVQGYILNDKGEIMKGTKPVDADIYADSALDGGSVSLPTTDIKL